MRALDLAHGLLNCMGRRTVTGMITANGQQFKDWSSAYRLFDGDRMDVGELFSVVRENLVDNQLTDQSPAYAHMDDTNTRKRGRRIVGTSWMRDPLGPPFHTNFIWGNDLYNSLCHYLKEKVLAGAGLFLWTSIIVLQ